MSAAGRVYVRSWYGVRGDANLGGVVSLEDQLPDMFPNRELPNIRGAGSYRRATWAWRYTPEDLRIELSSGVLKERRYRLSGGLLVEEAARDAGREMRN
jgi:hypothetical protein